MLSSSLQRMHLIAIVCLDILLDTTRFFSPHSSQNIIIIELLFTFFHYQNYAIR